MKLTFKKPSIQVINYNVKDNKFGHLFGKTSESVKI